MSNDYTTDTDFWDEDEDLSNSICNIALLEGPPGSGKTATVFALAAEMGFNVLEENASSNRSGKRVSQSKLILLSGLNPPSLGSLQALRGDPVPAGQAGCGQSVPEDHVPSQGAEDQEG